MKILILFFLAVNALAQHEVWVAPGPNRAGTIKVYGGGTVSNPFTGDWDSITSNNPPHTTFHLAAGRYWCMGDPGWPGIKQGDRILGAGMDITTIIHDRNFFTNRPTTVLSTYGSDVEFSDLTCDCNAVGNEVWAEEGVNMFSHHEYVHRVHVIHSYGCWATGQEGFAIFIMDLDPVAKQTSYNWVDESQVTDTLGIYTAAFGVEGNCTRCLALLPPATNVLQGIAYGFGLSGVSGTICENNLSVGGCYGFYGDTGWSSNVLVFHNTFHGALYGVGIHKDTQSGGMDGLTVADNLIELSPDAANGICPAAATPCGVEIRGAVSVANLTVRGNTIRYSGTNVLPAVWIYGPQITTVRITDNTITPGMPIHSGVPNPTFTGNYDSNGKPVTYDVGP